jgi:phosphatidate cytidylyltransferase
MAEDHGPYEDPPAARTERVRIIGAEQVGHAEPPPEEVVEPSPLPEPPPSLFEVDAELPHWTEPPTGEIPAVLNRSVVRDDDEQPDPWASMPAPSWREEQTDWEVNETFEPAMLADDEVRLGSLDEATDSERQPWTFLQSEFDEPLGGPEPEEALFAEVVEYADDVTISPPRIEVVLVEETAAALPEVAERTTGLILGDLDDGVGPGREARREPRRPLTRTASRRAAPSLPQAPEPAPPPPRPRVRPAFTQTDAAEREASSGRNMPVAIASGLALGIVMLVCFKLGTVTAMVIATAVVFLGAAEGFAAFRRGGYQPATLLGLVATLSVMVATYNKGQAALPLVFILLFAFCLLWYMAGVERGADPVRGTASTLMLFCWLGGFGSFAALLLSPAQFPHRQGIAFLLGAVITAVGYDVGALAFGAWIGRHPLAPSISPAKTWEGALGGALCGLLAAVLIVHFIHPWTLGKAATLGVVVAVVCPLGDLCESSIKRYLGVKDMGRILPGHGGLLDRVDGLLFVLPATFYLVKAFHLG